MLLGTAMQLSGANVPFFNYSIGRGMFSFFFGIFLMKIIIYFNSTKRKYVITSKILSIFIFICFVVLESQTTLIYGNNSMPFSVFFFAPLFIILYDLKIFNKFCSTKIVKFLGDISFNIYLLNGLFARITECVFICCLFSFNSLSYWSILIAISFEMVVGIVTYFLINKKYTAHLISKHCRENS